VGEVSKLRTAIAARLPEILNRLIEQALSGDVGAARLLLERCVPPIKATEQAVAIQLPQGTLTDQGKAVLQSVAAGELAPGQGAQLLAGIGALARVAEVDELEKRISAIEERQNGNT
jgi:hypothetical protein